MIDDFGRFWNTYPRKASVVTAREAWAIAITKASPEVIISAAQRLADDPNREAQFTSSPANWLVNERWHDDPLPPRKLSPTEAIENDLARAKTRDALERERSAQVAREFEEAKAKAVPLRPELKEELLAQWARNAYTIE